MITFERLSYKNFKAVGNHPVVIELNKHKTTLVTGKNGSGKSTITSALAFVLFGQDFELSKTGIINSINQKKLEVTVEFTVDKIKYKIIRGIKPAIFKIFKDDVLLNEDSATRDYQKMLETQILKMDMRAFKQVIVVGGSTHTPFMQLKAADRREFIEDLLDIRVFSTMGKLLKDKVKLLNEEMRSNNEELKSIKEKVSLQETFVKKLSNDKNDSISKIETQINQLKSKIFGVQINLKSELGILEVLHKTIEQYSDIQAEKIKLNHELTALCIKKNSHISKVQFYENTKVCPTCTQGIVDNHRTLIVDENSIIIDECTMQINQIEQNLVAIQEKINHQTSLNREIASTQNLISEYQNQICLNLSLIESAGQQIIELNSNSISIDDEKAKLKDFAIQYLAISKNRKAIFEAEQYNDFVQSLLADGGIKTKVIKQYIPAINKYINKYLSALDFFVSFYLDENFNESIKSRHRDTFTYQNFSDGQKARIDLAVMLAWRDTARARNAVSCNICFFDESDSALDLDGSELLMDLLKKSEKSNIFIISHKESLIDKVDNVIKFELKNNFTEIV